MAEEPEVGVESINTAVHGLKNELNRLHMLHQNIMAGIVPGFDPEVVWTRIVVIQEALLNLARAYKEKIEREVSIEKSAARGGKQLQRSANSRSRRMRQ